MTTAGSPIVRTKAALCEGFARAGFSRCGRAGMVFLRPLRSDVAAWAGLSFRTRTTAARQIGVRPIIGVRHEPLMRLYEQVSPGVTLATAPTIRVGLADLLGNSAMEWLFDGKEVAESRVATLVATVERIGLAWCLAHAQPEAMRTAVLDRRAFGVTHSNEQILPLLDLFYGEPASASQRLRASLAARADRTDDEAAEFRTFARNLLWHIERLGPP